MVDFNIEVTYNFKQHTSQLCIIWYKYYDDTGNFEINQSIKWYLTLNNIIIWNIIKYINDHKISDLIDYVNDLKWSNFNL